GGRRGGGGGRATALPVGGPAGHWTRCRTGARLRIPRGGGRQVTWPRSSVRGQVTFGRPHPRPPAGQFLRKPRFASQRRPLPGTLLLTGPQSTFCDFFTISWYLFRTFLPRSWA